MTFPDIRKLAAVLTNYKTPILAALGLTIFTYLYYILNFTFGNHSFPFIIEGTKWYFHQYIGRVFEQLPVALLQGGFYLPVLGPLLSLCAWFAAGIIFLGLFEIPGAGRPAFFYAASLFSLCPVLIGRLYYEAAELGGTCGMLALSLGAWLSAKGSGKKSLVAGALLIFYALGSNPSFISTIWVVLLLMLLLNSVSKLGNNVTRYVYASGIGIAMYFILVKVILTMPKYYNNQLGSISEILKAFLPLLKQSALYPFMTQPPMGWGYKSLYALFFFGSMIILIMRSEHRPLPSFKSITSIREYLAGGGRLLTILLLVCLYLFHNTSGYLSGNLWAGTSQMRIDFFTIPLILAISVYVCINSVIRSRLAKSIVCFLASIFIFLSVVADLRATQVWWITIQDDILYSNRLLMRIEAQPGFDASKRWQYLQLGDRPIFSHRFFKNIKGNTLELQRPMHINSTKHRIFNYIAPNLQIEGTKLSRKDICARYEHFLATTEAYPKPNSLLVADDLIIVTLDEKVARAYCARGGKHGK